MNLAPSFGFGENFVKISLYLYTLYKLRDFYHGHYSMPVDMECYQATIDLFLFVRRCRKHMFENGNYVQENLFDILDLVSEINENIFVQTAQFEILKIIVDEYVIQENEP